jgi:2-dehydro-3-deoxygalactonokinase
MPPSPSFISCDWGTTSLRLRWVDRQTGSILSELSSSSQGVRNTATTLPPDTSPTYRAQHFAQTLARTIQSWPEVSPHLASCPPIVISGMASSSIGWVELPYAPTPFPTNGSSAITRQLPLTIQNHTLPTLLISGLASPTDMMRGEETQLIGLLASRSRLNLNHSSLILLPGTHSKHARIQDHHITHLTTFMTGELFDVLHRHSTLQFTTTEANNSTNDPAFLEGVHAALQTGLMPALFQTRTRSVLRQLPHHSNTSFLSGLLIGAEILTLQSLPTSTPILIAAPHILAPPYSIAAQALLPRHQVDITTANELTHALILAHSTLLTSNAL